MDLREELSYLVPYTPGEQPPVRNRIIKLNTNENPYPPSPACLDAVQKVFAEGLLRKYPDPRAERLRKTIARIHEIDPDTILVTNGSDEAIRLLFTAVLRSDDALAYPDPTYSAYPVFADATLERIPKEAIPLTQDLRFNWSQMKKSKARLMAFANPNAPTGILEPRESIIDFLQSFPGFVLIDEAYVDFSKDRSGFVREVERFPRLFVSRTLSKSYSLAGLRLGYLVGSQSYISLLNKLRDTYNTGILDQEIAIASLKDTDYFESSRRKIICTREKVRNELNSLGFQIAPSSTNFLFAKPPFPLHASEIFQALREKEIYVRYFSTGIAAEYLRISIGTDQEMEIFLHELKRLL